MKRLYTILIMLVSISISAQAQLQAPVQYDTLEISSMTYHFEKIKEENWPYWFIVRTASSFIFGNQEFPILNSGDDAQNVKKFILRCTTGIPHLTYTEEKSGVIKIEFSNYIFECHGKGNKGQKVNEQKSSSSTKNPVVRLNGRRPVGYPTRPYVNASAEGAVVVEIQVNRKGRVLRAFPGASGTSTTNKELWEASRNAAMKTKFNVSPDSPEQQTGTITYFFK